MKRKLLGLLLATCLFASSLFMFAGCGEEVDTTLYHLTLSYSSNVEFDQSKLVATFAFGERHDITEREPDEVQMYLDNGATQEDIDKTIKRQDDGSYYFFDQDPIILSAPVGEEAEGYIFLGFFDKATNEKFMPMISPCVMDDGSTEMLMSRWNMPSRNTELEARYEVLNYSIKYCYGIDRGSGPSGLMPNGTHSNPATYNYGEEQDVTLTAPQEVSGYEFKYWYYRATGSAEIIKCEELPKIFDEGYIWPISTDSNGNAHYELVLWAFYDIPSFEVTVSCDNGVSVEIKDGDTTLDISTGTIEVEYGTQLQIIVDNSNIDVIYPGGDHEFDGIYINDVKAPDVDLGAGHTRPDSNFTTTITGETKIVIKVVEVKKPE